MPVAPERLDRVFNPKVVAVVGDKKASGYMWLKSVQSFKGKVYSVQVDPNEIPNIEALGFKNCKSLLDIPEPVDYVIVAVPRAVSPRIVADCIKKNVGGATLFTSGFAETSTPEGKELQDKLFHMAKDAGMILIGPNCMGVYNPSLNLGFFPEQPKYEGGTVSFSSQSGSHCHAMSVAAAANGFKINKAVSFGNGIVLENADYLEYFAGDPQTKVIGMYIEGLKDGRRFFKLLRETTPRKPVLIWKGGQTPDGARATSSHTASLAESAQVWDAVIRQTGAIRVDSMEEMVDTLKAVVYLPPVTGYGVALAGGAGGQSVSIADAFSKAGLKVPAISGESYKKLESFFSLVGASFKNPIDLGSNRAELDTILDIVSEDPAFHTVVMQIAMSVWLRTRSMGRAQLDATVRFKAKGKQAVIAVPYSVAPYQDGEKIAALDAELLAAGIPTFPTYDRAAKALKNVIDYYRNRG